jgi:hypothetical protein
VGDLVGDCSNPHGSPSLCASARCIIVRRSARPCTRGSSVRRLIAQWQSIVNCA